MPLLTLKNETLHFPNITHSKCSPSSLMSLKISGKMVAASVIKLLDKSMSAWHQEKVKLEACLIRHLF
jgi:hypothetical protein